MVGIVCPQLLSFVFFSPSESVVSLLLLTDYSWASSSFFLRDFAASCSLLYVCHTFSGHAKKNDTCVSWYVVCVLGKFNWGQIEVFDFSCFFVNVCF